MTTKSINLPFTFYGDLLGVSNFYRIDENIAHEKLSLFYNKVYEIFHELENKPNYDLTIFLFSDSLFITGHMLDETLKHLGYLYSILFQNNLLLRGAIVHGLLEFDPRLELKDMVKRLPQNDVLFRAVEIEKRNKGARIIIEKKLAQKILPPAWYTYEGYLQNYETSFISTHNICRKIRMSPTWDAYEYLWPLVDIKCFNSQQIRYNYSFYRNKLLWLKKTAPKEATQNINETRKLFDSIKHELNNQSL